MRKREGGLLAEELSDGLARLVHASHFARRGIHRAIVILHCEFNFSKAALMTSRGCTSRICSTGRRSGTRRLRHSLSSSARLATRFTDPLFKTSKSWSLKIKIKHDHLHVHHQSTQEKEESGTHRLGRCPVGSRGGSWDGRHLGTS